MPRGLPISNLSRRILPVTASLYKVREVRLQRLQVLTMAENEIVVIEDQSQEATPSSSSSFPVEEDDETKLKHLDFVQVAATYFAVCFSTLYEFAKDNAGPLKLGVENIEASVQTVLAPLYDKFHDVPFKLLLFVDRKVNQSNPIFIEFQWMMRDLLAGGRCVLRCGDICSVVGKASF